MLLKPPFRYSSDNTGTPSHSRIATYGTSSCAVLCASFAPSFAGESAAEVLQPFPISGPLC